jgi:dTDP-4-amino-4,6-dideoxygalactose transaminase
MEKNEIMPFNKPYLTGDELKYISKAVESGKISGNGIYTNKCQEWFEKVYGFNKCLLTTSCTDALEMCSILLNIKEGDEVIVPSFTFVSSALAFVRDGANIIFADSNELNPNIDAEKIESLITHRTKAIVVVHYAGISCDMDRIMEIANKYNIIVIEDAAQAIDSFYLGNKRGTSLLGNKPLGGIGHLAAFSFHETKNIIAGEGGMLVINDDRFIKRAEVIWEKGTNRSEFFRGEVNKYGWKDTGSSFLPSELISAFLFAQIEKLELIQNKRKKLWDKYYSLLSPVADEIGIRLPHLPDYATNNGHMFYILLNSIEERSEIINKLKEHKIMSVFHYLSLHASEYYTDKYIGESLSNSDHFSDVLLRLPLFFELEEEDIVRITSIIYDSRKKN